MMKVLVTGGTGFVGSHTVAELLKRGFEVRLLVRSKNRIAPALDPLGVADVEAVEGNVTDMESVRQAAEGCDATIHCGSVYSLDPRAAGVIRETNVAGTLNVINAALETGHDPVVHASSYVALIGTKGAVLTPDSPATTPPGPYFQSKADSDRIARSFQEQGAPVVITYPGSVWGPDDPHYGESCQIIEGVLKGRWVVTPVGTLPISDVRDIALLHAALMEKERGPRRYILPSTDVTIIDAVKMIASLTGRNLKTRSLPGWMLYQPMKLLDLIQLLLPPRLPFNSQAVYVSSLCHLSDDSRCFTDFGIEPRPLEDTMTDTVKWMVGGGYIKPSLAGKLAV